MPHAQPAEEGLYWPGLPWKSWAAAFPLPLFFSFSLPRPGSVFFVFIPRLIMLTEQWSPGHEWLVSRSILANCERRTGKVEMASHDRPLPVSDVTGSVLHLTLLHCIPERYNKLVLANALRTAYACVGAPMSEA